MYLDLSFNKLTGNIHIRYAKDGEEFKKVSEILIDIINTPISPELIPSDGDDKITQKTENIVGSYRLHDFFLYYLLCFMELLSVSILGRNT